MILLSINEYFSIYSHTSIDGEYLISLYVDSDEKDAYGSERFTGQWPIFMKILLELHLTN